MSRSRNRSLLIASFVWVLLIVGGAFLAYPSIGPIAASIEPNPFWSVVVTGDPTAPFRVHLKVGSWLAWSLGPVALLWLVAIIRTRQPSGHVA